jgi:hypothetical protein
MRRRCTQRVLGGVLCMFVFSVTAAAQDDQKNILIGSNLSKGFDLGVDSSGHEKKWFTRESDYMKMSFPAYQEWAALFITVGKPVDSPRLKWVDFSAYKTLTVDMKGEKGGETVEIGMKSNIQPDDGTETKITVKLIPEWKTYTFPLAGFTGTDLTHLYVVTEFVCNETTPQTVYFRNIKFVK